MDDDREAAPYGPGWSDASRMDPSSWAPPRRRARPRTLLLVVLAAVASAALGAPGVVEEWRTDGSLGWWRSAQATCHVVLVVVSLWQLARAVRDTRGDGAGARAQDG